MFSVLPATLLLLLKMKAGEGQGAAKAAEDLSA